jgi:O-antigen ligase
MTVRVASLRAPTSRAGQFRSAGWVAACLFAGAVCARLATSRYGWAAAEAIAAAFVLAMTVARPLVAMAVLLAVVSSVFGYGYLPRVPLPGHPPINVGDVCLVAAVGGTLWRKRWRGWPREVRWYFLALAGFLVLAAVATVKTSLLGYTQSREALTLYRNWLYLGAALTVVLELSGNLWRPFLNVAVTLAAVVAAISVAGAASHSVAHTLSSLSPLSSAVTSQSVSAGSAAVRVRVVGLYFVYAMCVPTLVMIMLIEDRWRGLRAAALVLMLAAIAVSLNRNMYGGLLVALALTVALGGASIRRRVAIASGSLVVVLSVAALIPAVAGVFFAAGRRADTALSPSSLAQSGSVQDRLYELRYAIPEIQRHPWFGIGPNQFYGAYVANPFDQPVPRDFIQNLYVFVGTDYGIPTALAFLLIPGVCLLSAIRRLPSARDPLDRALLAAGIGTLAALLISLVVGIYLQSPETTLAFGVTCGALLATAHRARHLATP